MKTKQLSKLFLSLFVVSGTVISLSLVYLKVKWDHQPVIKTVKPQLHQKEFSLVESRYLIFQKSSKNYFYKDYFQFLILQFLSVKGSQFSNQKVTFFYDDLINPTSARVVIGDDEKLIWNYSII